MFLLWFILYGTLCASWTWMTISFSILGTFSTIISSKTFSYLFFFSSSSGTPLICMLVCLIYSQRSLKLSSVLFILFTLFCSSEVISTILSSSSLIGSSASDILLSIISRVFLISVIVLFVYLCLFFNFSRSLLIDSCIFSICFQGFWSSLLSLFWILFQVVFLFPLHLFGLLCFYFVSSFVHYYSAFLKKKKKKLIVFKVSFSQSSRLNSFFLLVSFQVWSSGLCKLHIGRDLCWIFVVVCLFIFPLMGKAEWGGNPVFSWLGVYFCFVCCLYGMSCTGCYLWLLGDAGSCLQVISFVWFLITWYSLRLVLDSWSQCSDSTSSGLDLFRDSMVACL